MWNADTLRKIDHKTWMLKVRIVFDNIKYVKAYDYLIYKDITKHNL